MNLPAVFSLEHLGKPPCLVIAEVAQTHDGSLGQAHAFIDAVAKAGADAIKLQTHIAAAESTPAEPWRVKFSQQDATRYDYWKRMEFTPEQWAGLKQHAGAAGLLFLSSPFSLEAVALLEGIGMPAWKIASGEVSNLPLIEAVCQTGKPILLSSGMSALAELDAAAELVRAHGNKLLVFQCTNQYPCPPEKIGLNMLQELRARYGCAVGLSDHSGAIYAGLAAATLGAAAVEMHVTLSREMFGPDVPASLTTAELRQLVDGVRVIERMQASPVDKNATARELEPLRQLFTKSIVAAADLPAGTRLRPEHLTLKKPGTGLAASSLPEVLGRTLAKAVNADSQIAFADLV